MKTIVQVLVTVQCILLLSSWSYGASDKCTVVGAESNKLILKCNKNTKPFKVDDKIKIKSMRKKNIEGC